MNEVNLIRKVVEAFYEKAKTDFLIGYHFRHIHDFESHIPRICAFWETQLFGTTEKKIDKPFDILNIHIPLQIKRGELGRWIVLFKETLDKVQKENQNEEKIFQLWAEKLVFFEGVFIKFFSFK